MKRSPDVLDTAQSKGYSDGVDQAHTSKVEVGEVNSWRELWHLRDDCERRAGEEKPVKTEGVNRSLERLQIPKFDGDKYQNLMATNRSLQVFGQLFQQSWTRQVHFRNTKC